MQNHFIKYIGALLIIWSYIREKYLKTKLNILAHIKSKKKIKAN
jgi:hypothetical protein